jgi:CRP-like cAMP-binding protein
LQALATSQRHRTFFLARRKEPVKATLSTPGCDSAVGDLPLSVDALALGECRTEHFERVQFLKIVRSDPESAMLIARQISQSALEMTRLVIARSEPTLTARVYAVLQRLANHNAIVRSTGEITLAVSQHDLALAVGASRARVNIELQKLEAMRHIRLGYKHIVMLDMHEHPSATCWWTAVASRCRSS